ncbi:MAG: SpoVA/SpoVAEb family sporulation membrane protein [Oscillospiraceae bacterium]|nr:SpoVA/SpoVAEb family sporulation membrane protein [Oscillospiraceae bacterium]
MEILKAFIVGGLICVIGQILIDKTSLTPAKILVLFVVMGVVLGAVGIYEPLSKWAGSGANVPLTGFGNLLVQGTKKALREDGLLGAITGPLTSGAAGITGAFFAGLIVSLFARSKAK